jgi:hypothetical protein
VGIGTSTPTARLDVTGSSFATANVNFARRTDDTTVSTAVTWSSSDGNHMVRNSGGALTFNSGNTIGSSVGTERMRILSDGTVLMGLTSAGGVATTLYTYRSGGSSIVAKQEATNGDTISVWNSATSGNNLFLNFYTEGTATTRGFVDYLRSSNVVRYNTTSDATLKNLIGDSDKQKSLEILGSTRIREYAWKDDAEQKPQIGVIAQELYETYKGAVSVGGDIEKTDDQGNVTTEYRPWAVDKTAFTFHLISGWQEHQRIIQEQQAIIAQLQADVAELKGVA